MYVIVVDATVGAPEMTGNINPPFHICISRHHTSNNVGMKTTVQAIICQVIRHYSLLSTPLSSVKWEVLWSRICEGECGIWALLVTSVSDWKQVSLIVVGAEVIFVQSLANAS